MSNEHERLPRSVELAANIVAGHVRRTETSPDRFASLLMTAYEGIKALERAAANPGLSMTAVPSRTVEAAAPAPAPAPVRAKPAAAPAQVRSEAPVEGAKRRGRPPKVRVEEVAPAATAPVAAVPVEQVQEAPVVAAPVAKAPAAKVTPAKAPTARATARKAREDEPRLELQEEPQAPRATRQVSLEEDRASGYVRNGVQSVFFDRLICLDDDSEVTFLRRHLRSRGITEEEYRQRWDLPADYPMTAQSYVERKKADAAKSGFGKTLRPDRENRDAAEAAPPLAAARTTRSRSAPKRREGTLRPAYN